MYSFSWRLTVVTSLHKSFKSAPGTLIETILICFCSIYRVWLSATPWTAACQACPSPAPIACSKSCPQSVMPSNHLILCRVLLLPSIFPSTRVFSSESVLCIRWPKYWSFSFSISPCNEYSGLISQRVGQDWATELNWTDLSISGWFITLLHWWEKSPRISSCKGSFYFVSL